MMTTTVQLAESLQRLIDARLDTIDRMLLGRVPRQERLDIVKEVESQIFEQLPDWEGSKLTRDDVLAVLARLDPPEAYLADVAEESFSPAQSAVRISAIPTRAARPQRVARLAGILGLSGLGLALISPLILVFAELTGAITVAFVLCFATVALILAGGILGIVLGISSGLKGAWAITGLVTGIFCLLFAMFASLYLVAALTS
jgi:hypothetical protein